MPATKDRQVYVVLGMHRSGTSALAGLLAHAGARAPTHSMPGDVFNPKGYFESSRISSFNDLLLWKAGSNWCDLGGLDLEPLLRDEGALQEAERLLFEEYAEGDALVLKDPRLCRLLPFWRVVLERAHCQTFFVLGVRNPFDVGWSLQKRDGMPRAWALWLWLRYFIEAELATRNGPRVFVSFENLLTGWMSQLTRIDRALGTTFAARGAEESGVLDLFFDPRHRSRLPEAEQQALMAQFPLLAEVWRWGNEQADDRNPSSGALNTASEQMSAFDVADFDVLPSALLQSSQPGRAARFAARDARNEAARLLRYQNQLLRGRSLELARARAANERLGQEIDQARIAAENLNSQLDVARAGHFDLVSQVDTARRVQQQLLAQIDHARRGIDERGAEIAAAKEAQENLARQVEVARQINDDLQAQIERARTTIAACVDEIEAARRAHAERDRIEEALRHRIAALEASVAATQASTAQEGAEQVSTAQEGAEQGQSR